MKTFASIGAAVLALGLISTGAEAASIIANGSFETGTDPSPYATYGAGAFNGWTIDAGTIDYIGDYWQASDGVRSVDLAGNSPGTLSQTFATSIGTKYFVSFDLAGNPDNADKIKEIYSQVVSGGLTTFTASFDATGKSHADMGWTTFVYSFVASATQSTLSFQSLDQECCWGPALDNVSVSAVPLPAALPLFGAGLAAFGVFARRRRTRTAV